MTNRDKPTLRGRTSGFWRPQRRPQNGERTLNTNEPPEKRGFLGIRRKEILPICGEEGETSPVHAGELIIPSRRADSSEGETVDIERGAG